MSYDNLLVVFGIIGGVGVPIAAVFCTVGRREAIRHAARETARQFSGEVIDKKELIGAFDPRYYSGLTIRCHDGTTTTATVPIWFDRQFPLGCRVVKYSGEPWPVRAGVPPRNPDADHLTSPCYRTSSGVAVHVQPDCVCPTRRR